MKLIILVQYNTEIYLPMLENDNVLSGTLSIFANVLAFSIKIRSVKGMCPCECKHHSWSACSSSGHFTLHVFFWCGFASLFKYSDEHFNVREIVA